MYTAMITVCQKVRNCAQLSSLTPQDCTQSIFFHPVQITRQEIAHKAQRTYIQYHPPSEEHPNPNPSPWATFQLLGSPLPSSSALSIL